MWLPRTNGHSCDRGRGRTIVPLMAVLADMSSEAVFAHAYVAARAEFNKEILFFFTALTQARADAAAAARGGEGGSSYFTSNYENTRARTHTRARVIVCLQAGLLGFCGCSKVFTERRETLGLTAVTA